VHEAAHFILGRALKRGLLRVERLGRGYTWFDAGTHESLLQAAEFVRTIHRRQGLQVNCPEEIAYRLGYIDAEQVLRLAEPLKATEYGRYLVQTVEGGGAAGLARRKALQRASEVRAPVQAKRVTAVPPRKATEQRSSASRRGPFFSI
jgi:hypothetical protein